MAGWSINVGARDPADVVAFVVGAGSDPFSIGLNEVCIDWLDPVSQSNVLVNALGQNGYSFLYYSALTRPSVASCTEFGNVVMHVGVA